MTFTATATYESPSALGPPLVYTTISDVTLQRPDKLRVITPGDGPASEFYYDGKTMMAYAPAENLVAVADAPPTIDAALQRGLRLGRDLLPVHRRRRRRPLRRPRRRPEARLLHRPVARRRRDDDGHDRDRQRPACSHRCGSAPTTSCPARIRGDVSRRSVAAPPRGGALALAARRPGAGDAFTSSRAAGATESIRAPDPRASGAGRQGERRRRRRSARRTRMRNVVVPHSRGC